MERLAEWCFRLIVGLIWVGCILVMAYALAGFLAE